MSGMVTMILMDAVWLGLLMLDHFRANIGHLMRPEGQLPDGAYAIGAVIYLAMSGGIYAFVIRESRLDTPMWCSLLRGIGFGLVVFIVYEGTNYLFLRGWTLQVVAIDLFWGFCLFAGTTLTMRLCHRICLKKQSS